MATETNAAKPLPLAAPRCAHQGCHEPPGKVLRGDAHATSPELVGLCAVHRKQERDRHKTRPAVRPAMAALTRAEPARAAAPKPAPAPKSPPPAPQPPAPPPTVPAPKPSEPPQPPPAAVTHARRMNVARVRLIAEELRRHGVIPVSVADIGELAMLAWGMVDPDPVADARQLGASGAGDDAVAAQLERAGLMAKVG